MIDFSDIDEIRRTVEYCNRLSVHERHPYGGDLVYTAFSGTHQDAIGKGMARHAHRAEETGAPPEELPWDVPYLPIDPADVGRGYEAVIRVNSQSGKGGISYLLRTGYGLDLPRRLQIEFSRVVQEATDGSGEEITAAELWDLFRAEYLDASGPVSVAGWRTSSTGPHDFTGVVRVDGDGREHIGSGNGPIDALVAPCRPPGSRWTSCSSWSTPPSRALTPWPSPTPNVASTGSRRGARAVTRPCRRRRWRPFWRR